MFGCFAVRAACSQPIKFVQFDRDEKSSSSVGRIYSHIVIDSPPVLYFADSVILATSVEAVVVIARANYSSREVLSLKKETQDVRGNVVGIVLNDVPLGNFKYYNSVYYRQLEAADAEAAANGSLHLD